MGFSTLLETVFSVFDHLWTQYSLICPLTVGGKTGQTYNFPQGRVTDHRINLTLHRLEEFLEGEAFDEMIESLTLQAQEDSLSNLK